MSERKQEESFRVIDRRLFSEDGQLRQEVVDQERREASAPRPEAKPPAAAPPSAPAADAPAPSPAFKNLLAFLARNAELVLAGLPDPRTGRTVIDLESLRQIIDMLEVLRDKTKANLAAEDEQLLSDVIGDLKYSFLQVQQAAASPRPVPNPTSRKA